MTEFHGNGSTTMVHKRDAEGVLLIDSLTGRITQPNDERPDWAEGLVQAELAERHQFYSSRLGSAYTPAQAGAEAIAFEDLAWMTVDEEGEIVEGGQSADMEFRMEIVAAAVGITRPDQIGTEDMQVSGRVLAEYEINLDVERTAEEITAYQDAQREEFERTHATG